MMKPYRVGIIGLGRVAWLIERDPLRAKPCSHVGAWLARDDVALVAACDVDAERLAQFGNAFSVNALYTDYRAMLANESLDFVSICAYATERCLMVIAAAESGVKGIWCEKAAATSLQEMDQMAQALRTYGTQMIVSYMRRWENRYRVVRGYIAAGGIGRLQTINVHFTGNMLHTGTHAFDLLRMFAGEAVTVQAWLTEDNGRPVQSGYRYEGDEVDEDYGGNAVIHFDSDIIATIHGETKDYFRFELELLGSHGMVRIGNTQSENWIVGDSTYSAGLLELQRGEFPAFQENNIWIAAAADLVRSCESGGEVACDVVDARAALAIALAMHVSHRRGHQVVDPRGISTEMAVRSR